jgi:hypothetical protein
MKVKRGWAIVVLTAICGSLERGWLDTRRREAGHRMMRMMRMMKMRYLENALKESQVFKVHQSDYDSEIMEGYGIK